MSIFADLEKFLQELPDKVMHGVAEVVAEEATTYFKDSFTTKGFDGNPWKPGQPKDTGSLMVESGNLLNSITPVVISPERVVISAGNDKVGYARAHNEGFQGEVTINPFTRKKGAKVKQHTRLMNIPKRQFMGKTSQLADLLSVKIKTYLKSIL